MDATKMLNMENLVLPQPVYEAFGWNKKLVNASFEPMIQAEQKMDGSVSAFITTESKAILFFEDCKANGKVGRIINDEVTLTPFGDRVMVLAKASVCVDDVIKGTAVAGQTFQIGNVEEMDQCIQFASGIARSRALTNAGYGVVSGVTIPAPPLNLGDPANAGNPELPFRTDNLAGTVPGNPASVSAPTATGGYPVPDTVGNPSSAPAGYAPGNPAENPAVTPGYPIPGMAGTPAPVPPGYAPGVAPVPNDPVIWAKAVRWPQKKKTMGELLAMSPKDIQWAAENMRQDSDVKRASMILYPEACRMLGIAPKKIA